MLFHRFRIVAPIRQNQHHSKNSGTAAAPSRLLPERNHSQEEVMAVLNLSANEPYIAPTTNADSSALFPSAPAYARTPAKKSSSNLPLMIGLPVLAVVAGGLAWGLMSKPAQTPTVDEAPPAQVAEATPLPAAVEPPAPMPTPAPVAATPAPTQVARAETAPPPRVTTPKRAAPARRAAPQSAPDASSASSNVSANVPAPVAAPPAPPVVIAAPVAAAPAPAPTPAPAATPDTPM
jgi:Meckel syndrome type 1 protein